VAIRRMQVGGWDARCRIACRAGARVCTAGPAPWTYTLGCMSSAVDAVCGARARAQYATAGSSTACWLCLPGGLCLAVGGAIPQAGSVPPMHN
jgi:hypothetical protein